MIIRKLQQSRSREEAYCHWLFNNLELSGKTPAATNWENLTQLLVAKVNSNFDY